MERLGHEVTRLDVDALMLPASHVGNWLRIRALFGPAVTAVNRAVRSGYDTDSFVRAVQAELSSRS